MSSITAFEEMHHLEPHVRSGRAQAGVIMFIISDVLSILALVAAGGYLNALDTLRQFRAGGHPPAGTADSRCSGAERTRLLRVGARRAQEPGGRSAGNLHSGRGPHDLDPGGSNLGRLNPGLCRPFPCLREFDHAAYMVFSLPPPAGSNYRLTSVRADYTWQVGRASIHRTGHWLLVVLHSDCRRDPLAVRYIPLVQTVGIWRRFNEHLG